MHHHRPAEAMDSKAGGRADLRRRNPSPMRNQVTFTENVTSPGASCVSPPRSWRQDKGRTRKVISLLIVGNPPAAVARKLQISSRLELYHRKKAEEIALIKRINKTKPFLYGPGPNFPFLDEVLGKGGSGPRIVTSHCRLHPPQGNAYAFAVRPGDVDHFRTPEGRSSHAFQYEAQDLWKFISPVPAHVLGYTGGCITLLFRWSSRGGCSSSLIISSLPELRLSHPRVLEAALGRTGGPYSPILDWIKNLLVFNGWTVGKLTSSPNHYHFAFELESVRTSCPELLQGVSFLERGQEEANLILWQDRSHGTPELETTEPGIALDIFSILHVHIRRQGLGVPSHSRTTSSESIKDREVSI